MMYMGKYIMMKGGLATETPYIFLGTEDHSTVARAVGGVDNVLSAGFVYLDDGKVYCTGKSKTLDIGPRDVDSELIKMMLRNPMY